MKLRAAKGKLKIEHSIIPGVRDFLERLLAGTPEVRAVIPGVIRQVRDARGPVRVRITVETTNGWKAIATKRRRAAGAVHQHRALETGIGAGY